MSGPESVSGSSAPNRAETVRGPAESDLCIAGRLQPFRSTSRAPRDHVGDVAVRGRASWA